MQFLHLRNMLLMQLVYAKEDIDTKHAFEEYEFPAYKIGSNTKESYSIPAWIITNALTNLDASWMMMWTSDALPTFDMELSHWTR